MSRLKTSRQAERGLSLIVTLVLAAGASVLIGGVLFYTSSQSTLTRRVNQYDDSVAAAVAATEKVVASITKDFQVGGDATVLNSLNSYRGLVPKVDDLQGDGGGGGILGGLLGGGGGGQSGSQSAPNADWSKYEFADPQGQIHQTDVERVSDWTFRDLNSKFPGLRGYAADYRIISNAREKNRSYHIVSAVRQDIQVASIPLNQFQFYYVPDLELHPSTPGLTLNGRVHCNASMYFQPAVDLNFQHHVTAARAVQHRKHPADPTVRPSKKINYRAEREGGVNTLNIPIGPSAGPAELRQIVEAPIAPESPTSLLAQERLYNKADLVIVVSNDVVTGRSGSYNGGSVSVPWLGTRGIVTRSAQRFHDKRQTVDIKISEFDVAKFIAPANQNDLSQILGRPAKTIWMIDLGDTGQRKKKDKDKDDDDDKGKDKDDDDDKGKGKDKDDDDDWEDDDDGDKGKGKGNDKDDDDDGKKKNDKKDKDDDDDKGAAPILGGVVAGATTPLGAIRIINGQTLPAVGLTIATPNPIYVLGNFNANAAPALLAGDAITILSLNWADANSGGLLSSRIAGNTTVNAAIITGIVPTGGGDYSGGAENALRLLENWNGKTLTFKGSIAVLYYSKVADAPWGGAEVYAPPNRSWSYDVAMKNAAKIPPGMPAVRTVFRSDWTVVKPKSKL